MSMKRKYRLLLNVYSNDQEIIYSIQTEDNKSGNVYHIHKYVYICK